jgi:hypothetical protein
LTIIEVHSAAGTASNLSDVADGGSVETALAVAMGTVTNAATGSSGEALVVLYGSGASSGNAGLYSVVFANGADAVTGNMTVELIGIVSSVVADSFVSGNFA